MREQVHVAGQILWNYLKLDQPMHPCNIIVALCSIDTRVAERAAELFIAGFGEYLVFSGKSSKLTQERFKESEAQTFANIALKHKVPADKILIEDKSTNTGENVRFTHKLLQERGILPSSVLLVHKPYMERRAYATFKKQWPDKFTEVIVTSPQVSYEQYFNNENNAEIVLNTMVSDMQRIKEYPKLGFQIEQDIPTGVWAAYETLVELGYGRRLLEELAG